MNAKPVKSLRAQKYIHPSFKIMIFQLSEVGPTSKITRLTIVVGGKNILTRIWKSNRVSIRSQILLVFRGDSLSSSHFFTHSVSLVTFFQKLNFPTISAIS